MRRLSRLSKSIDPLRPQPLACQSSSFLCPACRSQAPFSTSARRFTQPGSLSTTERLRRKIWGTDTPPGYKDAYGGPSIAEEKEAARAAEELAENEKKIDGPEIQQKETRAPILDASYEPAKTWDGLEEVGELPAPEFFFEGYLRANAVTDPYKITAALHRAVVEVFTLRKAGRPLSELSYADTGIDRTSDVKISVPLSNRSAPVLEFSEITPEEAILESLEGKRVAAAEVSAEHSLGVKYLDEPLDKGTSAAEDLQAEGLEDLQRKEYKRQRASWSQAWLQISLDDFEVKFAVGQALHSSIVY